jgi:hypothetical protein
MVDVKEGHHKGLPGPPGPADLTFQFSKPRTASIYASQPIEDSTLTVLGRCFTVSGGLQTVSGTFSAVNESGLAVEFRLSTLHSPRLPIFESPFPVDRSFPTGQH